MFDEASALYPIAVLALFFAVAAELALFPIAILFVLPPSFALPSSDAS